MSMNLPIPTTSFSNNIQNKGFLLIDSLFKDEGWYLSENQINKICYTKFGYETDIFDIQIMENNIQVSIPVRNSPYQYITKFTDYLQANEYLEARFKDYIRL